MDRILGLGLSAERHDSLDAEIEALIEERRAARAGRDFARADDIRRRLESRGILLEDTSAGTRWKRA
jgi:cysteinyl-tRNA synthetase